MSTKQNERRHSYSTLTFFDTSFKVYDLDNEDEKKRQDAAFRRWVLHGMFFQPLVGITLVTSILVGVAWLVTNLLAYFGISQFAAMSVQQALYWGGVIIAVLTPIVSIVNIKDMHVYVAAETRTSTRW